LSRIQQRLTSLNGNKALVAFFTAGDPDLNASKEIFTTIENNGVDIVEIGVPFSDPLADGPTIQASSHRSLKNGTTLKKIIQLVADIRKTSELPIVLMTSFNPIFVYGEKEFISDAIKVGVDGLIIPDLPPEEANRFLNISAGLDLIFLLAPTSTLERVQQIGNLSKGFIYYISLTGTTGTKETLSAGIHEKVREIKNHVSLPILVGFGISTPDQAKQAVELADGVILGSSIVKIIENNSDKIIRDKKLGEFLSSIQKAINP
tara:strand:+ start:492 stop:1277 length:786 start_codon:yes stop_codon:yes gene_type:complete